ncbi:MAG: aminoacyl-tRNA hydrolase [Acidobacteria bacterium]|nr:aminoacyl-tRNA hydrolase [Acidobacteriota bacterium]
MRAITGLGNPGNEYADTRHNAGWMLLDLLRQRGRILERREKELVELEKLKLGPDAVWLMRPKTYMNGSGEGVLQACRSLQIEARDVLVAYDDIDLPLGQIRLRRAGGAGGHRGLESVIAELGTPQIPRLRIGVRGETRGRDTAGYVLAPFEAGEREAIEVAVARSADAVRMMLRRGIGAAMNTYNKKPEPPSPEGSDEE